MSLKASISILQQRLTSHKHQLAQKEQLLKEVSAQFSSINQEIERIKAEQASAQEAVDLLLAHENSLKKEVPNDSVKSKTTSRKSRSSSSNY